MPMNLERKRWMDQMTPSARARYRGEYVPGETRLTSANNRDGDVGQTPAQGTTAIQEPMQGGGVRAVLLNPMQSDIGLTMAKGLKPSQTSARARMRAAIESSALAQQRTQDSIARREKETKAYNDTLIAKEREKGLGAERVAQGNRAAAMERVKFAEGSRTNRAIQLAGMRSSDLERRGVFVGTVLHEMKMAESLEQDKAKAKAVGDVGLAKAILVEQARAYSNIIVKHATGEASDKEAAQAQEGLKKLRSDTGVGVVPGEKQPGATTVQNSGTSITNQGKEAVTPGTQGSTETKAAAEEEALRVGSMSAKEQKELVDAGKYTFSEVMRANEFYNRRRALIAKEAQSIKR